MELKNHIFKDSRLYLGEGQKGGTFGAISTSLIPSLIGPTAKLFDGAKKIEKRKKKKILK